MSDDADDDPQLKSLRAVWLSMPDEDPPERGLAELMAAARVKAEKMTKPSLWQRIAALLRRPPVFALATVLIIIGGVVFIGNRKDKLQHEETAGGENAPAIAPGSAATVEAPGGALQEKAKDEAKPAEISLEQREEAQRAPEPEPVVPVTPSKPRPPTRRATPTDSVGATRGLAPSGGGGTGAGARGDQKLDFEAKKTGEDIRAKTTTTGHEGRFETEKPTISSDTFATEPTADKLEPNAGAAAPSDDRAATTSRPPPANTTSTSTSRAAQYLAQARSAAARGDCSAARVMMKRVQSEDAAAYKKAVASDASLKKCVVAAQ